MSRAPLYIFDLDSTLADITHRVHFIEGDTKDWHAFFRACSEDTPIEPVIRTLQTLKKAGAEIWIWTGRSEEVRQQTIAWCVEHGIFRGRWRPLSAPESLLMRPRNDKRPDWVIKQEWYMRLDPPEYNRLTATFDDSPEVVEMWRRNNVTCFQLEDPREGNE